MAKKIYTADDVLKIQRVARLIDVRSLDEKIGTENLDTDISLGDTIESDFNLIDEVSKSMLSGYIEKLLKDLSPREAAVISMRYGLKDGIPRTLEEVGKVYGVTRERIRQIEVHALRRLRRGLVKHYDIKTIDDI